MPGLHICALLLNATIFSVRLSRLSRLHEHEMQAVSLPVEVFHQILVHLDPLSLLQLSRSSKWIRSLLLRQSAARFWREAREREGIVLKLSSPDGKGGGGGWNEARYARLLFEDACMSCGIAHEQLQVRCNIKLCPPCLRSSFLTRSAFLLLPQSQRTRSPFEPFEPIKGTIRERQGPVSPASETWDLLSGVYPAAGKGEQEYFIPELMRLNDELVDVAAMAAATTVVEEKESVLQAFRARCWREKHEALLNSACIENAVQDRKRRERRLREERRSQVCSLLDDTVLPILQQSAFSSHSGTDLMPVVRAFRDAGDSTLFELFPSAAGPMSGDLRRTWTKGWERELGSRLLEEGRRFLNAAESFWCDATRVVAQDATDQATDDPSPYLLQTAFACSECHTILGVSSIVSHFASSTEECGWACPTTDRRQLALLREVYDAVKLADDKSGWRSGPWIGGGSTRLPRFEGLKETAKEFYCIGCAAAEAEGQERKGLTAMAMLQHASDPRRRCGQLSIGIIPGARWDL